MTASPASRTIAFTAYGVTVAIEIDDPGLEEAVTAADAVVVATNHSVFSSPDTLAVIGSRAAPYCIVVDPWNALGAAQVFAYVSEVASLRV